MANSRDCIDQIYIDQSVYRPAVGVLEFGLSLAWIVISVMVAYSDVMMVTLVGMKSEC